MKLFTWTPTGWIEKRTCDWTRPNEKNVRSKTRPPSQTLFGSEDRPDLQGPSFFRCRANRDEEAAKSANTLNLPQFCLGTDDKCTLARLP